MSLPFGFSGDYLSWSEAERRCTGDQPEFRLKAMEAARSVADGHAMHVRDGVLFDEIVYSWPLLAGLMYVAARSHGRISVLDFGGGPGITYLQNRRFLSRFNQVDWRIIEKPDYCAFCRTSMRIPGVSFYESIDDALNRRSLSDAVIFSNVLPLIEDPYQLLSDIGARSIPHILIDRTWISLEGRDRLAVFRAGRNAHANMSRPWWFLSEKRLLSVLEPHYALIEKFDVSGISAPFPAEQVGYIFSHRIPVS
jgi:putative methyltransferase (TIGR04325 family)